MRGGRREEVKRLQALLIMAYPCTNSSLSESSGGPVLRPLLAAAAEEDDALP